MSVVARFDQAVEAYAANDVSLIAVYGNGGVKLWSPPFIPTLVSVTTPGTYNVPWPAGATKCDIVLCGGAAGGGTADIGTLSGMDTTANYGNIRASGGEAATGTIPNASQIPGKSPGDKIFNGQTYPGGIGGSMPSAPYPAAGIDGTEPGAGGSGFIYNASVATFGGAAGEWAAVTVNKTDEYIHGQVGTGGQGSPAATPLPASGDGAHGAAYFYFHQ